MPTDNNKSLTGAVQIVYEALEPLDEPIRVRVLDSVRALLGMPLPQTTPPQDPASRHGPVDDGLDQDGSKASRAKPLSIRELIQQKKPATNAQRLAIFAYHLEKQEGKDRFARADLLPMFEKAKLTKPGNYDRDFAAAAKEGWIHEEGENSYLTDTGERAVETGFGGKGKARGRAVAKKPSVAKR